MSNIEEDVIDVIAFLAFHQSISNSLQQTNKLQQTNYNKVFTIRKVQYYIYQYIDTNCRRLCFSLSWIICKIYIPRDHTH